MGSIFLAKITYTVPIEQIDALLDAHLAWLTAGYEAGHFMAWGPNEPRDSGLVFLRADNRSDARELMASDPFITGHAAKVEIIEWTPRFVGPGLEAFGG